MISIFFSYSHQDEVLRNKLETHLAILKRKGFIDTWHDRRRGSGKAVHAEISEQLIRQISSFCWWAQTFLRQIMATTLR